MGTVEWEIEVGVATETDFFGPDRKSRPTERTGRTGLRGPIFSVLCRVYGKAALFRESARLPPVPLPVGPNGPNGPVKVSQKVETDRPNTFLTSVAIPR
jgi:hypothetical protein